MKNAERPSRIDSPTTRIELCAVLRKKSCNRICDSRSSSSSSEVHPDILYLNIGDPVKFGFGTPNHVIQELVRAIGRGENYYSDSEGLPELRYAIAERENRRNGISLDQNDVVVTNGISEGISLLMGALINPGDEVLISDPCYPPYLAYLRFFQGKPVTYRTNEENGWAPDLKDIRSKISKKTRAIVLVNPNNPTGSFYKEEILKQICSIASENSLLLISDEIYDEIVYEEESKKNLAALSTDNPVITLNGFSKSSLMTGWRLGYLYFKESNSSLAELREAIARQTRIRLCANTPVQRAGIAALTQGREHVRLMVDELRKRRDYSMRRVALINELKCSKPEAAFYIFPKITGIGTTWKTDTDFVLDLLSSTGLLVVPGSGFGPVYGAQHFRLVFLPPIDTLEKVWGKLEEFFVARIKK